MVLGCGRTNDQHKPRKSKVDVCPPGGGSPVITTIGYGDFAQRSLQNPCARVQMTDHIHATGATMSSGQREQGTHALRGRRHPRSADSSSTVCLSRLPRLSMQPRKYAWLPGRGVCMGTAGWRCLGPLSRRLAPCFPNRPRPGPANDGSGCCVRYCTTVLQPPMQTLGFESSQCLSRRTPMRAAALMSRNRCLGLQRRG